MQAFLRFAAFLLPFTATAAYLALLLAPGMFGIAADTPTQLSIRESRSYSLDELSQLVRTNAHIDFHVDRRHKERSFFVSRGDYPLPAFLYQLALAARMKVRKVRDTYFLAEVPTISQTHVTLLSDALLKRLDHALVPIERQLSLADEGIPFSVKDFRTNKEQSFASLSAVQQLFVAKAHSFMTQTQDAGKRVTDLQLTSDAVKAEKEALARNKIRLGTSYLLVFISHKSDDKKTPPDFQVIQLYYDYADRLRSRTSQD